MFFMLYDESENSAVILNFPVLRGPACVIYPEIGRGLRLGGS
jgi:hypothetical protein